MGIWNSGCRKRRAYFNVVWYVRRFVINSSSHIEQGRV